MVRALVNQIPGFKFTNYLSTFSILQSSQYGIETLISMDDMKAILDEHWQKFPDRKQ